MFTDLNKSILLQDPERRRVSNQSTAEQRLQTNALKRIANRQGSGAGRNPSIPKRKSDPVIQLRSSLFQMDVVESNKPDKLTRIQDSEGELFSRIVGLES
nr:hypothetical protein [Horticoccus luteus]